MHYGFVLTTSKLFIQYITYTYSHHIIYIYIYIHTYTYIYTYLHIHIHDIHIYYTIHTQTLIYLYIYINFDHTWFLFLLALIVLLTIQVIIFDWVDTQFPSVLRPTHIHFCYYKYKSKCKFWGFNLWSHTSSINKIKFKPFIPKFGFYHAVFIRYYQVG